MLHLLLLHLLPQLVSAQAAIPDLRDPDELFVALVKYNEQLHDKIVLWLIGGGAAAAFLAGGLALGITLAANISKKRRNSHSAVNYTVSDLSAPATPRSRWLRALPLFMATGAKAVVNPPDHILAKTYLLATIAEKERNLRLCKWVVVGTLVVPAAVVWVALFFVLWYCRSYRSGRAQAAVSRGKGGGL